jgi:hypothetical protein
MSIISDRIQVLRKQRRYQHLLKFLYEIPEFKEWLEIVARQCNVVNPVFYKDEKEILWHESRRQLFTSWLKMLGEDDLSHIIDRIEQHNREES